MNEEQIARFEANIERLVESAFANFFGKKLRAQDIALQLARAMDDHLRPSSGGDPRPLAPDHYRIYINPQIYAYLSQRQPTLPDMLSQHIIALANQADYRLMHTPLIDFIGDPSQDENDLHVTADHTNRHETSTAAMQKVVIPVTPSERPFRAFLLINSEKSVPIEADLINIGRNRDNDLIIDDPYVSRYHVQMRRRFNTYLLFDISTQTGTLVNGVRIKEHQLQAGDVIQIGKTQIVYMDDQQPDDQALAQTDTFDPVV
jgi:hypothetical protein